MKSVKTILSLQLLRGIAAILVVFYHSYKYNSITLDYEYINGFFKFGYSGVDIFFVLSGFIIYYIHRQDISKKNRLLPYIKKRFIRIFPVYWLCTLGVLILFLLFYPKDPEYSLQQGMLITSFFLIPSSFQPIIGVAWTLIHEVRFYIFFGIAIFFPKKILFPFTVAIVLFSFINLVNNFFSLGINFTPLGSYLYSYYNLEFLSGVLICYLVITKKLPTKLYYLYLSVILFLVSAYVKESLFSQLGDSYRLLFYGIPSSLIIFNLVSLEFNQGADIPPFFILLGDASYVIYLTHQVLISIFSRIPLYLHLDNWQRNIITASIVVMLTIVTGLLIHIFIERRVLLYSRKLLKS